MIYHMRTEMRQSLECMTINELYDTILFHHIFQVYNLSTLYDMSYVMRKPALSYANNKGADQRLCYSLRRQYNTSTCYSRNFKTLARLWRWAGRLESYLVQNPEDRFSRDKAHMIS